MLLGFLAAIPLYVFAVLVAYNPAIKSSEWYMPAGMSLAFLTNILWYMMIAKVNDKGQIMTMAFTWDAMRLLIYAITPILLLGAPLEPKRVLACILIGAGMCLLNL